MVPNQQKIRHDKIQEVRHDDTQEVSHVCTVYDNNNIIIFHYQ